MKLPLTTKQQKTYSFISQYVERHEQSPSLQEIRLHIGVSSLNTVVDHVKALEQKGYILRRKHAKRGIELRNIETQSVMTWTKMIPVVASVGCDDLSVFATDYESMSDESIGIDQKLIEGRGDVVAVRATGNSMNEADIHDGDYVLLQLTEHAESGDRIAAIVDGMITVKRYEKRNGVTILMPESKDPKYRPIILNHDFKIAGKVICAIPGRSMDITEVVYDK